MKAQAQTAAGAVAHRGDALTIDELAASVEALLHDAAALRRESAPWQDAAMREAFNRWCDAMIVERDAIGGDERVPTIVYAALADLYRACFAAGWFCCRRKGWR